MAQDAYPVPGRAVTLPEFRAYARSYAAEVTTGLEVFADSTGRHVKVRPGSSTVDGVFFTSTAIETLAIEPNTSGNTRIDSVVLRLDPAASPVVQLKVKPGVPAASPAGPALERDPAGVWEVQRGAVHVPPGAVTISAEQVVNRVVERKIETTSVVHILPSGGGWLWAVNTWLKPTPYPRAIILSNGDVPANPAQLELSTMILEPNKTTVAVGYTRASAGMCRFNFIAIPLTF